MSTLQYKKKLPDLAGGQSLKTCRNKNDCLLSSIQSKKYIAAKDVMGEQNNSRSQWFAKTLKTKTKLLHTVSQTQ